MKDLILQIAILALPILIAVVFHEVAHGWVANRLGDSTAARMGRLTLNPIPHIDFIGTIVLPALLIISNAPFLFGYAKPVPVNFYNLRHPKRDMIWVALAGPVMNLVLAFVFVLILKLGGSILGGGAASASALANFFVPILWMAEYGIRINILLAVFNALPLPPLDGGRVLVGILPEPFSSKVARIEPIGFLILIVLLMTHMFDKIIGPAVGFLLRFYSGLL